MRFMVMLKSTPETEAGIVPPESTFAEMTRYNEELVRNGVMLAGEGLQPSSKGAKLVFANGRKTVVDGPFAETKELIAGFWMIQARSMDEAIEWVKRAPFPTDSNTTIEIRPIFEADDFGDSFTPELREREAQMTAEINARKR